MYDVLMPPPILPIALLFWTLIVPTVTSWKVTVPPLLAVLESKVGVFTCCTGELTFSSPPEIWLPVALMFPIVTVLNVMLPAVLPDRFGWLTQYTGQQKSSSPLVTVLSI